MQKLLLILIIFSSGNFSFSECINTDLKFSAPKKPGFFSINFKNLTNKIYKDDQIYIYFLGFDGPALKDRDLKLVTVKIDGSDEFGSLGHQVEAQKDAKLSALKLSDIKNQVLYLPEKASQEFPKDGRYYGSRIYFSLGKPMDTFMVNSNINGLSMPTFSDHDPDKDTIFDWIEFTYDPENSAQGPGKVTFGGNTTGVDQFAIPFFMSALGDKGSVDGPVGIMLRDKKYSPVCINSRQELIKNFLSSVSSEFKTLAQGMGPARILSPVKSGKFMAESANYFDSYIAEFWEFFKTNRLNFCTDYDANKAFGTCYAGQIVDNELSFYNLKNSRDCTEQNPCRMRKPTSKEIFTNSGVFARPGDLKRYPNGVVDYNAFGAQLAAALARHTATNIIPSGALKGFADWHGKFLGAYEKEPNNEYAKYFHSVGINHRFYGMGYDDVAAPSKSQDKSDLRPVGAPLIYINRPQEKLESLIIGIQM
jgi:hypothetical protein